MQSMIKAFLLATLAIGAGAGPACADDANLKPFVLAFKGAGNVADNVAVAKAALQANGFEVVGSYSPYADTTILVVTNDEMKNAAAKTEHGGFGAAQRISITKVREEVQVAYTNPAYMANGYRMSDNLPVTTARLQTALGKGEEFGANGISAKQLRKFHYMVL